MTYSPEICYCCDKLAAYVYVRHEIVMSATGRCAKHRVRGVIDPWREITIQEYRVYVIMLT